MSTLRIKLLRDELLVFHANISDDLTVGDLTQLGEFVDKYVDQQTEPVVRLLGATSFFFAIRDFCDNGRKEVLDSAERALDSFYIVAEDVVVNANLECGIKELREHLSPSRNTNQQKLLNKTIVYLRGKASDI